MHYNTVENVVSIEILFQFQTLNIFKMYLFRLKT